MKRKRALLRRGIDNIQWTVYGKIAGIIKDEDKNPATTTDKTSILYTYDASGNRISKRVTPSSGNGVTTVYVRDASGNVMSVYEKRGAEALTQAELHLNGSSRLGMVTEKSIASQTGIHLDGDFGTATADVYTIGNKLFELSNHLGNVLATVSDMKIPVDSDEDGKNDFYLPDDVTAMNYYLGGMQMPGRNCSPEYTIELSPKRKKFGSEGDIATDIFCREVTKLKK